MTKTLSMMLDEQEKRKQEGAWVPASCGTEEPFFTRGGVKLLYCWQPSTGKHAYLDCGTDLILTDEEAERVLQKA